jgi:hypothetical protein
MNLPTFAFAGLMTVGLAADAGHVHPSATDPILILYVGAEDCAPCRAWRRDDKPAFLAAMDQNRLHYREVIAPKLPQVFEEHVWPDDLRRYRSTAERERGVPLWLVVRNNNIIAVAAGASMWRSRVLPLIMRVY